MKHVTKQELLSDLKAMEEKAELNRELAASSSMPPGSRETHLQIAASYDTIADQIREAIKLEYDPVDPYTHIKINEIKKTAHQRAISFSNVICGYYPGFHTHDGLYYFPRYINKIDAVWIERHYVGDILGDGYFVYKVFIKSGRDSFIVAEYDTKAEAESLLKQIAKEQEEKAK